MARRQALAPCAACSMLCASAKLSRVVIEGRTVVLCREHASVVAANMPRSYDELRALFREPTSESAPLARRSRIERRGRDDRRMFPPRPEGRRQSGGRRSTDKAA